MNSESFREFESVFNENESKIILLPDIRSYLFFSYSASLYVISTSMTKNRYLFIPLELQALRGVL